MKCVRKFLNKIMPRKRKKINATRVYSNLDTSNYVQNGCFTSREAQAVDWWVTNFQNPNIGGLGATPFWDKSHAIYLMYGNTLSCKGLNLKNISGGTTFDISYGGTLTHNYLGVQGNGSTGQGDTGITPSSDLSIDDISVFIGYRNAPLVRSSLDFGVNSTGTDSIIFTPNYDGVNGRASINGLEFTFPAIIESGVHGMTRDSSTSVKIYKNGTLHHTENNNSSSQSSQNIWINAANGAGGGVNSYSENLLNFTWVGQALTDSEASVLSGLITKPTQLVDLGQPSLLSFPNAEGFGRYATGGRGGIVIKVTNLNDSGAGSFRDAVQNYSVPRIVVFEVGGTINLSDNIYTNHDNLTIAGQSASGDGICLKGGSLVIDSSNVIVRYIRIRSGAGSPNDSDGIQIAAFSGDLTENIMVDHVSVGWAIDENLNPRAEGSGRVKNVTFSNMIISENKYGVLIDGNSYRTTYHRNLQALNSERNIRPRGKVFSELCSEMINCLIYGFRRPHQQAGGTKCSAIGNHFKDSSGVTRLSSNIFERTTSDTVAPIGNTELYLDDNIIPAGASLADSAITPYLVSSPRDSSSISPIAASSVESTILSTVGCSLPTRDSIDQKIVDNWTNGDGDLSYTENYPVLSNGSPLTDTSGDGIPDTWAISKGFLITDDLSSYIWSSGYIGVEEYLNEISN